jgi:sialate O-acetylesterase
MSASRLLAAVVLGMLALPAGADPLLNPVFQDHAVLQRDRPIHLWGTAAPGSEVKATIAAASVDARADAAGRWSADLPAMQAGGPYMLTVRSGDAAPQTVNDVLIGDVYLCSGQSNMAYPVMSALDAGSDVQISANDRIRLMTVATATRAAAQTVLLQPVKWEPAAPQSVARFSAACYYFGRELQKSVDVPLGLIQAPWSGANITAFMSADALHQTGVEEARLEALTRYAGNEADGLQRWGEVIEAWWRSKGLTPWTDPAVSAAWPKAPEGLGIWTTWNVPALDHFVGHVWFRTTVTLTAAEAAEAAQLSLGTLTEEDQTWVNGRFVAATFGYGEKRSYALASGLLHEGVNDVLVNVNCGWRGCGIFGPAADRAVRLKSGGGVPLSAAWRYQPVPASVGTSPRVPWGATSGLAVIYNAMIAPLGSYGLRGIVWYQGESNTGAPAAYRQLLKLWMADWRKQFGNPALPFLIVQLPDNGLPPIKPENSGWAQLRESQRLAVAEDANAALAVTIDIGDHMGLHPANKLEVGRRLALGARRLIYGDKTVKPGPQPSSAVRNRKNVTVGFTGANGALMAVNADQPIGFELCGATLQSCRFAAATIRGDTVSLIVPQGLDPTRVRYCWGDGPVCTLYDTTRIPAVPFELPVAAGGHK